jgi:hypothetical protein
MTVLGEGKPQGCQPITNNTARNYWSVRIVGLNCNWELEVGCFFLKLGMGVIGDRSGFSTVVKRVP